MRHHTAGRIDEAVARYDRALSADPEYADAHNNLAVALLTLGRIDEAAPHFERALVLKPASADAHNNLGNWLAEQGKLDQALKHFERAIAIRPDYAEAHFNRAEIKTFQPGDPELAALERLATRNDLPASSVPYIHFALGKALEDSGDYPRAFEHLRKGNEARRRQIEYEEASAARIFERTAAVFSSGLFERFRGVGDPSPVPIFVLGMPRSGSTLVEQILASHPQVHAAGELTDLDQALYGVLGGLQYPECAPSLDGATLRRIGEAYVTRISAVANNKTRIVDKLPGNFLNIGLIHLVLPHARIVHTMRDPMDTCVSCYSKLFSASQHYSYDLGELGRHYCRYRQMMAHWRSVLPPGSILDVSYEDVVDDLEGQARRLIDYCGLAWDDRCIDFHRADRPVQTASAAQARRPLFRSSLQRWRKYEPSLGPLLRELSGVKTEPVA